MFARTIKVEIIGPDGDRLCPLSWLDNFCMRSFTGRTAFDDTLPVSDGEMEAGFNVDLEALRADMESWMARKFGEGGAIRLKLTPR